MLAGQDRRGVRLRRCRQGKRQSLRGQGCRVIVTEIDPICALQAAMEGYEVSTLEDVLEQGRHLHHHHGQQGHHHAEHMAKMKDKAIVGNIGHFDNEIHMAA
jgi:adenosylhomocysteinase